MERVFVITGALIALGCGGGTDPDAALDAAMDARAPNDAARDAVVADTGASDASPADATPSDASPPDAAASDAASASGFAVLTINLQNSYVNGSTWPERRDAIAAAIVAWQPDVVCAEEATESGGDPNGAEEIASATGYAHVLEITHEAFVFREGIAALSRWPILASETERLPITDFSILERAILSVDLDVPGGARRVFCSHMSVSTDEADKADEAVAAYRFIDARRGAMPAFFAGDFNAEPETLAMRILRGDASHDGVTGDLTDAWTSANPSDPGFTIPSDAPDRRIDYVYVVPASSGAIGTIRSCERVFTMPVSGSTYASDHVGVLCRFSSPD